MTTGLCLRSSDGEGTCFTDNVDSSLLVHSFSPGLIRPAGAPRRNSGVIWKVRTERVCLLFLRRNGCREKTPLPQSERDKSLSGKVSGSAGLCVCVCVGTRERERERLAFPHRRLIASTEKLSFLFSIRRELSLFLSQPPTETTGECHTWAQNRFSSHQHTDYCNH